jgi:hypothetical protein
LPSIATLKPVIGTAARIAHQINNSWVTSVE